MISRRQFCTSAFVLLSASSTAAEPAVVLSAANLRSAPTTNSKVVAKLPAGTTVQVSNCREWCAADWEGNRGFAIATALDRSGRAPARRAGNRSDPFATNVTGNNAVLDTPRSTYEAPARYYGPVFWTYGPASGPYKGTTGIGYRGRW